MTAESTGFFLHPASGRHDTGWRHPEHQGRLRAVSSSLENATPELLGRVRFGEPAKAGVEDLLRVHTPDHVERIREAVAEARIASEEGRADGAIVSLDPDTKVSAASWEAALGSVGAALAAGKEVADGELRNAFVAARPPGHHATPARAMGFCLFNTVAVLARWLQATGRAERVLVVDWDVHHGNGTQDAFYDDPTVYFLSLHQSPHYPGTGAAEERGAGKGEGTTLNVPLPAGLPRDEYRAAFDRALGTVRGDFAPDFLLISSGFDVLAGDPLGGQLLEPEDLGRMAADLVRWAERDFEGRVVALLEGGYVPERVGEGVVAVVKGMSHSPDDDPPVRERVDRTGSDLSDDGRVGDQR